MVMFSSFLFPGLFLLLLNSELVRYLQRLRLVPYLFYFYYDGHILSPTSRIISFSVILIASVFSSDILFSASSSFVSRKFCRFPYLFFVGTLM